MPKYAFFDLETTGLDPQTCKILEIGAIAAADDAGIESVAIFQRAVHFIRGTLPISPNVQKMHANNGLWLACEQTDPHCTIDYLDKAFVDWLKQNGYERGKTILCGHSIHFDRSFIQVHMPVTYEYLSHRMVDTGAMSRLLREFGIDLPKEESSSHRAMADAWMARRELRAIYSLAKEYAELKRGG